MSTETRYRAYVIYGGQWVYGRSGWHDGYAAALREGRATCNKEEREFIGVVRDGVGNTVFEEILLRGLEKTGSVGA